MTEACTVCTGSLHPNGPWRCETCGAEFECATALVALPTPTQDRTGHQSLPLIGFKPTHVTESGARRGSAASRSATAATPVYALDEVTCGPVMGDRARELAERQKRRASIHIVATEEK